MGAGSGITDSNEVRLSRSNQVSFKSIFLPIQHYTARTLFPSNTSFCLSWQVRHRRSNHYANVACRMNMPKIQNDIERTPRNNEMKWVILLSEIAKFGLNQPKRFSIDRKTMPG
jgi:hypothetical protein